METVFTTAEVHVRDRFDFWHAAAEKSMVHHDTRTDCRERFEAEIKAGALADMGLVVFTSSTREIAHTARHAANADDGKIFLCRQNMGWSTFEHGGRRVALVPSEMTLLDPRSAYSGAFSDGSGMTILKIPRAALEARFGRSQDALALRIGGKSGLSALLSNMLRDVPSHVGALDPTSAETVGNQLVELAALALATAAGEGDRLSSSRAIALIRVRAAIEARLADPTLDSAKVAAVARVSVRYANALLASEGASIMRFVQTRRLDRCRRALEDPAQRHRTISEIAYGWGFSDMTHFGRAFRVAYGVSPREHRRTCADSGWPSRGG